MSGEKIADGTPPGRDKIRSISSVTCQLRVHMLLMMQHFCGQVLHQMSPVGRAVPSSYCWFAS